MHEIPSNTLLTIIIILAGSLSISQLFPYKNEPMYSRLNIDRAINILIVMIISFITVIVFNLLPNNIQLVDDILVGLSALLAFASVVKSIKNNEERENKKELNEEENAKIRLETYLNNVLDAFKILDFLEEDNIQAYISIQHTLNEIRKNIEHDYRIMNYIQSKDMSSLLSTLRCTNITNINEISSLELMEMQTKVNKEFVISIKTNIEAQIKKISTYSDIKIH